MPKSEDTFAKALQFEKDGETKKSELYLKLACKQDADERGLAVA